MDEKRMKKRAILISILFFGFSLSTPLKAQEIETVDGVRVVHNEEGGKWGKDLPIKIELVRTIGDIDTLDENLAFNSPSDLILDDAGNIYILDAGNCRIQKFDPEGKFLDSFGREGQGPGEFQSPASLDFDAKGNLIIADWRSRKIQIFSKEGSLLKTITMTKNPISRVYALNSGLLATLGTLGYDIEGKDNEPLPKLIRLLDLEGSIEREFGEMFDYKNRMVNQKGNVFDFVVDENDFIYLAFSHQNRIDKYSPDGKLLWKADRVLNYTTKPLDKGKIERTKTSQSFYSPRMNSVSSGIAVDNKGRSWVITYKRQIKEEERVYTITRSSQAGMTREIQGNTDLQETDMYALEIFDADGVLLGEIPLNRFVDEIYIDNDNLFLLDQMRGVKYYQYNIINEDVPNC
jgi:sugar lactone lactonase YvrE